ncbi:MAG TPA: hypothetical protein VGV65_09275 [Nocardioides sp.]|nr:hypothetical protein [Nocardioides sp.]
METYTITRQPLPDLWEQILALVRGGHLDDRLARGADPREDALLQARSTWLTSPARRAKLADALLGALDQARETGAVVDTRVAVAKYAVLDAEPHLVRLADALQGRHHVDAGPVARVRRLLADGKGPLYTGDGLSAVVAGLAGELACRN